MKTIFAKTGRLLGLTTAALLAVVAPAAQAVTQPSSPEGQWDCVITGAGQSGIIFLNFTTDTDINTGLPTFEGLIAQAGRKRPASGSTSGSRTTSSASFTNVFGGGFISGSAGDVNHNGDPEWLEDSRGHRGSWFFNSKGQVIGSFYTVVNATGNVTNFFDTCIDEFVPIALTNGNTFFAPVQFCFTAPVVATNYPWGPASDGETGTIFLSFVNTNFTVGAAGVTNNVSFVGKVVQGKRLTMVGNSLFGKFTISGVPLVPVTTALPVDGFFWTGVKVQDGAKYAEQFTLLADPIIPNVYSVSGQGPSYTYNGTNSYCMISSKKRIAFVINEIGVGLSDSPVGRATFGTLISNSKAIGTKGLGDSSSSLNLIQFNANLSPFILP